jgi:glycyl-tRNA synthetase
VAILPLVKNKPELVAFAGKLHAELQRRYNVFYDAAGAIGRRYRRMDEVGTPFCVTVDFDTIEKDNKVTLRERDSGAQTRLSVEELLKTLEDRILGP